MAVHRYWRLYINEKGSDATYCNVREVELRASIGGADETGSGTASASSFQSAGFEATKAFDNNSSTCWAFTAATPQWLKYDFGAGNEKDIVQLAMTSYVGWQMFQSWELQYSDDDSAWTTVFTIVNDPIWNDNEQRTFSASDSPTQNGNKTFWRINSSSAQDGGSLFSLAEISMAATFGGADQATGGKAFSSDAYRYDNRPDRAFDDSTSSFFASSNNNGHNLPAWIGYRWGTAKDVVQLALTTRNDIWYGQGPKNFSLEYWDGSAYQTALTVTNAVWGTGTTNTYYMAYGAEERVSKMDGWAAIGAVDSAQVSHVAGYAVHGTAQDAISVAALEGYAILTAAAAPAARPQVFAAT